MINEKMASDLRALGIKSDDTVLVHSSMKSLGYVEGGPDTVIDTLMHVLSEGTLLLPALSFKTVRPETPEFSVKDTPSCVGLISETFRKREGVYRSVHPSHSVCAIGKYAKEMTEKHINSTTPVGPDSPFALLPKYNGKVLMLGCTLTPNTSMHGVEEAAGVYYVLSEETYPYKLTLEDGTVVEKNYQVHNLNGNGIGQRYIRLANFMQITFGKVLEANCHLIDAKTMWEVGCEQLAKNELAFGELVKR